MRKSTTCPTAMRSLSVPGVARSPIASTSPSVTGAAGTIARISDAASAEPFCHVPRSQLTTIHVQLVVNLRLAQQPPSSGTEAPCHLTTAGVVITDLLPIALTQVGFTHGGAVITRTPGITCAWRVPDLETNQGGVESEHRRLKMSNIPTEMRALVLNGYETHLDTAIRNLQLGTRPIPKLKPRQVLVKIEAAPCNPSDLAFLQGMYGVVKPLPAVPGWEGVGRVVAAGSWMGKWLMGRRVAAGGGGNQDGTWAEYYAADAFGGCVPLRKDVDSEQGATLLINPLTAVGLLDEAKRHGAQAVVQTAAASQVGRMIIHMARAAGTPLVNIVRREEQAHLLGRLGAQHVLNSSNPDFFGQLGDTCRRLKVTAAFDAVAGDMTGYLLEAMPEGGVVWVYGGLSYAACSGISPLGLIFQDKQVEGFWLTQWIRERGLLTVMRASNRVQKLMASGKLATTIQRRVGLDGAVDALLHYKDNMTAGKILIKPGL
jgi:NADPH2:quinone reductase